MHDVRQRTVSHITRLLKIISYLALFIAKITRHFATSNWQKAAWLYYHFCCSNTTTFAVDYRRHFAKRTLISYSVIPQCKALSSRIAK